MAGGIWQDGSSQVGSSNDISSQHPSYVYRIPDWEQMRHTWSGQRAVKAQGQLYLPATSGMIADGMETPTAPGAKAYNAYLCRALFHSFVSNAVDTMLGMMWNKPPVFELPKGGELDYLKDKATVGGEGLNQLLRSINREQLITGRMGALVDLPKQSGSSPRPYIATYTAESIINWDAGYRGELATEVTNLVVLNETAPQRISMFQWEDRKAYRVLMLGKGESNESAGVYRFGLFQQDVTGTSPMFDEKLMKAASSRGKPFDRIPWTFINANSTLSEPCDPPLLGLSDLCLAIYRLEADYRQALFMQTQDTLFTKGWPDDKSVTMRTGAGSRIHAPVQHADAKYIGVTSTGLPELRTARENDLKLAASKSGELMDASSRARESGTALEMRIGSKTATMNEIAISGGEGLQRALRDVAQWIGIKDLESIIVKPNFEFASREFAAADFKAVVESKMLGGPISWEAVHKWSAERGGPGKDLTFEAMMQQIEDEGILEESLAPKVTPSEQAELDMRQQEIDAGIEADKQKAKADMVKAKQKPKPAAKK